MAAVPAWSDATDVGDGRVKVAWYGDDFTGATDTLSTAARAGLKALLFLGLPNEAQLERAGPLDALGIAGSARSMNPADMAAELQPVAEFFARLRVPVTHYKTCSTFDSAPHVGSIGAAVATLRAQVESAFVPIVGGQPNLGRYCLFGNLFAAAGGTVHRIDRHPTMSRHPVTPMHEADLRLHLAQQGLARMASVDYTAYAQSAEALDRQLDALLAGKPDAVLLDVAQPGDLAAIGRVIWQRAQRQRLLTAGPSSVVQALAAHWQGGVDGPLASLPAIAPADGPVLVLAGSLSPMTARQVAAATSYDQLLLDAPRLAGDADYRSRVAADIAARLREGARVLAATSAGGGASATAGTDARALAAACGVLLADVLQRHPIKRLGIAGGDTSSLAVQALAAWGLSWQAQLAPGVALCRLHSDVASLDGLELMLKGGQMGGESLFEDLLRGVD